MRSTVVAAAIGFGLGAFASIAIALGSSQPGGEHSPATPPNEPVQRELVLIARGLFREGSRLPLDREQSIEQMLNAQAELLAKLSDRLAALDTGKLDSLDRRLASLERTLEALEASPSAALTRRLDSLERSIAAMSRDISGLPQTDLSSIQRTLEDLRRQFKLHSAADDHDDELRAIQSTLRSMETQLRSIERKLR
ncbi:MAG: hypothetical protein Kow0022_13760 [Phycisphaerales bacterium]